MYVYVSIVCDLAHEGHIVNGYSILTHAGIESDLAEDEKNQLVTFGKKGGTALNAKNGSIRLLSNRTYDSNLIYRIVKKTSDIAVW